MNTEWLDYELPETTEDQTTRYLSSVIDQIVRSLLLYVVIQYCGCFLEIKIICCYYIFFIFNLKLFHDEKFMSLQFKKDLKRMIIEIYRRYLMEMWGRSLRNLNLLKCFSLHVFSRYPKGKHSNFKFIDKTF